MLNGAFSRNIHGRGDRATRSSVPGSESVLVRDIADVKDAFHGNYESPNLDTRVDRGSLRWALLATASAIVVGIGVLALVGFLSGTRLNRTELPDSVLHSVTCRPVGDQVAFSGTYDAAQGATLPAMADAEGLEVEVSLLDDFGVLVATETVWIDVNSVSRESADSSANASSIGNTASVHFDEAVASPRCETTIWAA